MVDSKWGTGGPTERTIRYHKQQVCMGRAARNDVLYAHHQDDEVPPSSSSHKKVALRLDYQERYIELSVSACHRRYGITLSFMQKSGKQKKTKTKKR